MSMFSRLFRKPAPATPAEPARAPSAPSAAPPRPDPAVVARAEEASVGQAIAAGDRDAVEKWVLEGSSTHVRQMAARAITDAAQLGRLIPAVRGRDKNVYRILTARREEHVAREREAQRRLAEAEEAAAAIARHAERTYDASFTATLARLEARWVAVATDASPERQVEVDGKLAQAHAIVAAHEREAEAEAERQRVAALAAEAAKRQREEAARLAAEAAQERARLLEAEREAERVRHEAEDAQVRALLGLLRQAQAALDHGGTARAARLRDAIREKLPHAPPLPPWFERKLQEVDARLGELQDWRTFTVVPKRAELVQRMQSLVGADMSPEEVAKQVRRLRDEWRTLHRGVNDEAVPEREQFEQLAERAYEPCREHFARQAERRKENQARREALIERLAVFAAGQAAEPNWRAVQQALAESRREWREHAPVDQDVVESLQARFHAVLDGLQGQLDAEYERNVRARRDLVTRAAALATLDDTRQAVEEAKTLQREWKDVGLVPRQLDDALWQDFRRHCDAVFQRSSQAAAAHGAALESSQARALTLCGDVERLASLTGDALLAGVQPLGGWRDEFDALDLPRAAARDLRRRFARAVERCEDALRRERAQSTRRAWSALFAAAAAVRAYALRSMHDPASGEVESARAAAEAAIAGLEHAPRPARQAIERNFAAVASGDAAADCAANEAALRLLCVRAETVAGVETPPEDLELRREYQMRRLVGSMERGERPTPADLDDLALEWLSIGPVDAAVHDALLARFERCLDAGAR